MATTVIGSVQLAIKTTAEWAAMTIALLDGQPGYEIMVDGGRRQKIGDGIHLWADLPYIGGPENSSVLPPDFFTSDGKINAIYIPDGSGGGGNPYFMGRTIQFFGDSFTQMDLFATSVSNNLSLARVIKDGVSGSCVAPGYGADVNTPSAVARIDAALALNVYSEAIFFMEGTNDWAFSVPLGTINDPFNYVVLNSVIISMPEQNTFYAALKYCFSRMADDKPGRVFGATMMVRGDQESNYAGQTAFANAFKEVAALYNAPVYDTLNDSGITYANISTYSSDLIHPDLPAGKLKMTQVIGDFLLARGIVLNNQPQLGQSVLTIGDVTESTIGVNYTAVSHATKYAILMDTGDAASATEVGNVSGLSYTAQNLAPATGYNFRVIPLSPGYKPGLPSAVKLGTTLSGAGGGGTPLITTLVNQNVTVNSNGTYSYATSDSFGATVSDLVIPEGVTSIIEFRVPASTNSGMLGVNYGTDVNGFNNIAASIHWNHVTNTTGKFNGTSGNNGTNHDDFTIRTFTGTPIARLRVELTQIFQEYTFDNRATWQTIDDQVITRPAGVLRVKTFFPDDNNSIVSLTQTNMVAP